MAALKAELYLEYLGMRTELVPDGYPEEHAWKA